MKKLLKDTVVVETFLLTFNIFNWFLLLFLFGVSMYNSLLIAGALQFTELVVRRIYRLKKAYNG